MDQMDSISDLPDELLLEILSLLPAKDVVATMLLSKRWKFLWKLVPKIDLDHNMYQTDEFLKYARFVNSSLPLYSAPVLETLHFNFIIDPNFNGILNMEASAINLCVRELIVETDYQFSLYKAHVLLPRSLSRSKVVSMLVRLKLSNVVLLDVTSLISFPSLKKLILTSVKYLGDADFVKRFLSGCPVLEDLVVERCPGDNVMIFTISVPSLQSLWLTTHPFKDDALGFVINAPSLAFLSMADYACGFCIIEKKMPKIVYVSLDVNYSDTKQLLESVASVRELYLCLSTSMETYHQGRTYRHLVRLELCVCKTEWLNLLMRLLKDSPKLKVLKLDEYHQIRTGHVWPCWSEPPSCIPKCLSFSLESFTWVQYQGRQEEKQVARFILLNSKCLKTATFYHKSTDPEEKQRMLRELSMLPRIPTCQLVLKQSYGQVPRQR